MKEEKKEAQVKECMRQIMLSTYFCHTLITIGEPYQRPYIRETMHSVLNL